MPQSPERKREYAKERLAANGDAMRAAAAEWRGKNREYLADKSTARRLSKRAMCLAAAARQARVTRPRTSGSSATANRCRYSRGLSIASSRASR